MTLRTYYWNSPGKNQNKGSIFRDRRSGSMFFTFWMWYLWKVNNWIYFLNKLRILVCYYRFWRQSPKTALLLIYLVGDSLLQDVAPVKFVRSLLTSALVFHSSMRRQSPHRCFLLSTSSSYVEAIVASSYSLSRCHLVLIPFIYHPWTSVWSPRRTYHALSCLSLSLGETVSPKETLPYFIAFAISALCFFAFSLNIFLYSFARTAFWPSVRCLLFSATEIRHLPRIIQGNQKNHNFFI